MNGKTCWSKAGLLDTSGTHRCGDISTEEESFRVTGCYVALEENERLIVRVWTSLDADASDESFAIDNVVVRPLQDEGEQLYWRGCVKTDDY